MVLESELPALRRVDISLVRILRRLIIVFYRPALKRACGNP
jgi:hypothetical protein